MSEENVVADDLCCASCGVAEVDGNDIKLRSAPLAISFDIVAMHVRKNIDHITNENAKSGPLNYVTSCYSSNQKAPILGTARSA